MAMADGGPDDLPRTFRRERDAQREAREREARERANLDQAFAPPPEPSYTAESGYDAFGGQSFQPPYDAGVVTAIKVPFWHLVTFFLKAVFAAIPALLLLILLIVGAGQAIKAVAPHLLVMDISIKTFPGGQR